VLVALALVACGSDDPSVTAAQADDPVVVTGVWPIAELIERIAGGRVVVINLTPVDESPHDLELTSRQRDEVGAADLAVVIGGGFQADLERAVDAGAVEVLSLVDELDLPDEPVGGHIWLDPTLMGTIATTVGEALARIDPDGASDHRRRAEEVVEEVVALDAQIRDGLSDCARDVIVTQHDSFGWFAARYGLRALPLDAADPDDDPAPDPALLAAVKPLLEDGSVATLFTETLVPPGFLEVIADEHGLETEVLNPYEGLTEDEDGGELDYESVLLYDLQVLEDHLDCSSPD
jgi:zinc transport system substrate-binding protein